MNYKIKFNRHVAGLEEVDVTVEADSEELALQKLNASEFKTYLVQKRDLKPTDPIFIQEFNRVA